MCLSASDPRPKKCWLLTLHPPASACRMVTCVNPCQCLTLLSDPIKNKKIAAARGQSQRSKTQKMLAPNAYPPVSACRMVTCVNPCQCLTLLSDPMKKSRKMQLPAAKASGPRPKKCCLRTLHPPASACRMVTCVNPCQCLTLLSDPLKKSRKMQLPAAKACLSVCVSVSQRSKTQNMLASNASSPCQRVSNGYLCQPLPVPNVAF